MSERWTDKKTGFTGSVPSNATGLSFQRFLKESLGNIFSTKMTRTEPDGSSVIIKGHGKYEKIIASEKKEEVSGVSSSLVLLFCHGNDKPIIKEIDVTRNSFRVIKTYEVNYAGLHFEFDAFDEKGVLAISIGDIQWSNIYKLPILIFTWGDIWGSSVERHLVTVEADGLLSRDLLLPSSPFIQSDLFFAGKKPNNFSLSESHYIRYGQIVTSPVASTITIYKIGLNLSEAEQLSTMNSQVISPVKGLVLSNGALFEVTPGMIVATPMGDNLGWTLISKIIQAGKKIVWSVTSVSSNPDSFWFYSTTIETEVRIANIDSPNNYTVLYREATVEISSTYTSGGNTYGYRYRSNGCINNICYLPDRNLFCLFVNAAWKIGYVQLPDQEMIRPRLVVLDSDGHLLYEIPLPYSSDSYNNFCKLTTAFNIN